MVQPIEQSPDRKEGGEISKRRRETSLYQNLEGKFRARLVGTEAMIELKPLYEYHMADRSGSKLSSLDNEKAAKIMSKDPTTGEIIEGAAEQIVADKKLGGEVKQRVEMTIALEQILREAGVSQIFVADSTKDDKGNIIAPGFDDAKLGHRVNFSDTTLVVPFGKKDTIKKLVTQDNIDTGLGSAVEGGTSFNENQRFQFLSEDIGFNFKFGNKEFTILFYEDGADTARSEGLDLSKAEEDLYMDFIRIRNKYGDNANIDAVKKEVLEMIVSKNLFVPDKVKSLLKHDKWFPSDKEIQEAKDGKSNFTSVHD